MARVALPQSKLKARRRRKLVVSILLAVFAVLLLAGGAVALSWAPFARIHTIEIVGASSVSTSSIESIVREKLSGAYFYIFARDNIVFYPEEEIRTALSTQFPVFGSVGTTIRDFNTLRIDVIERQPHALWCGESSSSASACFLLDEGGVVYAPAADFSGDIYIKYFGPMSEVGETKQFVTPDQFRSLSALAEAVQEQAKSAVISVSVGDMAGTIHFANNLELMFSLKDDGADVLERFTLALGAEPFTKHALSDFEYLDLRFGDKLYYKLKE